MKQLEIGCWIDECLCAMCMRYGPGTGSMSTSHADRVLVLVGHFLDSCIVASNPSGFYPFYAEHAEETVAALDEVGLSEAARFSREVNTMFRSSSGRHQNGRKTDRVAAPSGT